MKERVQSMITKHTHTRIIILKFTRENKITTKWIKSHENCLSFAKGHKIVFMHITIIAAAATTTTSRHMPRMPQPICLSNELLIIYLLIFFSFLAHRALCQYSNCSTSHLIRVRRARKKNATLRINCQVSNINMKAHYAFCTQMMLTFKKM